MHAFIVTRKIWKTQREHRWYATSRYSLCTVPDLHRQMASFLQDSDIHLSLKHFLTACCLESVGVMSRTSVPVFHNGQKDHHTLTLSHGNKNIQSIFLIECNVHIYTSKSLKAPCICCFKLLIDFFTRRRRIALSV